MEPKSYRPVSCDFHSELESLAVKKRVCPIVFRGKDGKLVEVESVIVDIYTRNKEEFLLLSDGEVVRLDRLISVAGLTLKDYC